MLGRVHDIESLLDCSRFQLGRWVLAMTALLARVAAFFVEPAVAVPGTAGNIGPDAALPVVGVVAQPADSRAAAGALALELARRYRSGVSLVCLWSGSDDDDPPWRAPAAPAASQLAAGLAARRHRTFATGRLAVVRLCAREDGAVAEAGTAVAAAGAAPVVIAIGAARGDGLDRFLATLDLVVVAVAQGAADGLSGLALAGIASQGPVGAVAGDGARHRAALLDLPPGPGGRVLAAAGVALLPSLAREAAKTVDLLA
jgi:hypothetical protein